jgi:cytochrome c oxidase subunit 2
MTQQGAFYLFICLSAVVVVAFLFTARSNRRPKEIGTEVPYRLRKWLFLILSFSLLLFLGLTLPLMPYPDDNEKPDRVVYVRARQFLFELSENPFPSDGSMQTPPTPLASVPAGELIEFRVVTADVTHGFGLYTHEGDLISQVQAMPGYVNRLRVRFSEPGVYNILCMEYCGVTHHVMRSMLRVETPQPSS